MSYTYTQEWRNISEAALKIEPVTGYYGHKTIRETYKQLIEDLNNSMLEYELFSGDELRHTGVRLDFLTSDFLTNGDMCELDQIPTSIRTANMHYITKIFTDELLAAESDGVLGENVDAESIDIYYLAIAALLEQTVSVYGDLKPSRVLENIIGCTESSLPITARGKRDVRYLIKFGRLSGRSWAFYELGDTDKFLLVEPANIDQDTLYKQMLEVWLGHPETLLDRARYAYGLCDPCHEPINLVKWFLRNRECEQAYKLQPICGEYGESIFSLSQYTSENVA
nr:MAG TPA: hypothetical protein [Caudoviricetes sp.]